MAEDDVSSTVELPNKKEGKSTSKRSSTASTTTAKKPSGPSKKRAREQPPEEDSAAKESRTAFRQAQRILRKSASTVDLKTALQRSFSQSNNNNSNSAADASHGTGSPPMLSPLLLQRSMSSSGSAAMMLSRTFPSVPSPNSAGSLPTPFPSASADATLSPLTPNTLGTAGGPQQRTAAVDITSRFLAKLSDQRKGDVERIIQRQLSAQQSSTSTNQQLSNGMIRHRSTRIAAAVTQKTVVRTPGGFLSSLPHTGEDDDDEDDHEGGEEDVEEELQIATVDESQSFLYSSKENSQSLGTAKMPRPLNATMVVGAAAAANNNNDSSDVHGDGKSALLRSFLQEDAVRSTPRSALTTLAIHHGESNSLTTRIAAAPAAGGSKDDELLNSLARKHQMLKMQREMKAQAQTSSTKHSLAPNNPLTNAPKPQASTSSSVEVVRNLTSVAQRRAAALLNNVSLTDVSFLKRANSFDHSNSQSMVFSSSEKKN